MSLELVTCNTNILDTILLNKLPEEVVNKIYKEYLEPEAYYIIYKKIIESPNSMSLDGKELVNFLPTLLAKQLVCKYVMDKCVTFNSSYKLHKIKNKKTFVLMKKGESFAAHILFALYH